MELQKMNGHTKEDGFDGLEAINPECEEFLPHKPDGKKETHFTDFEGKTSFGMSVFNLSNAIMGSGILGLAFAMSNTGIILFITLLIFIAILSAYSIHLLLKSAGVVGIRAYEQLGNRAFGAPGKMVAACVITIHNIGAMSSYLFIVKSELPLVIQAFLGKRRTQGYLGYTSGFSLSCMVFFLICVIYKKFNIPVLWKTFTTPTAYTIPILAFAFVCHPEVLPIYTELRESCGVGAAAHYIRVDPLDVLILCVRLAVLVAVTLTVPVVLFPIRRAIQQILFPEKPFHWVRHILIAFSLIFLVNLLVIFVPSIRDIFGIIGATSAPSLIFILPGIFYIRIIPKEQEPMVSRPKIQAACFAGLGFIFMVMSLSFIIIDWVTGESRSGGGH
ncbi:hypothetical protein WMY93_030996 [Mugilogobius chulae]|uniref:Amino acid transporter transmembrane domain-containing protein n=1 Tax=Mugilogobius chulae TaxID=88201 RepID=A0AAW0MH54_9GOBI